MFTWSIFWPALCASAVVAQPSKTDTPNGLMKDLTLTAFRHVFLAEFCCAFKSCVWFQECQAHIARWAVALFRNDQVYGQTVAFHRSGGFVIIRIRLVQQTNQVRILFNRT